MKAITIYVTDAEYANLMQKANYIRNDCESNYKGYLKPAKEMLAMCAKLNL